MKAVALLSGPKGEWPQNLASKIKLAQKKDALIMASDRGSLFLLGLGIVPDIVLGDYDSLTNHERRLVESKVEDMRYSSPVKDLTDSEILYYAAFTDYRVDDLIVYGATSGRLNHFLANMYAVLKAPFNQFKEQIRFVDKQNIVRFFDKGRHLISYNSNYKYLGIGTLTEVKDFSIRDAKYNLAPVNLKVPTVYSLNEYLRQRAVTASYRLGVLVVISNRDKK